MYLDYCYLYKKWHSTQNFAGEELAGTSGEGPAGLCSYSAAGTSMELFYLKPIRLSGQGPKFLNCRYPGFWSDKESVGRPNPLWL
jgi:hypothetical protein